MLNKQKNKKTSLKLRTLLCRVAKKGEIGMIFKERKKPYRLKVMECLANRMNLSRDNRNKLHNWNKGYTGEVLRFDPLTNQLTCDGLVLNDLYLEVKGKSCQLDAVLITEQEFTIYEVKNFEGEYYYQNGKMYHGRTRKEVFDPVYQVRNAESIVRQLVDQLGYQLTVKKYIVFVNPNFTLFEAPRDNGLILPTMIDAHFAAVNEISNPLSSTHYQFAEELKTMHKEDNSLHNVPYYDDELLKKGVTCVQCGRFVTRFTKKRSCTCNHCGKEELVSHTILRLARECKLLFPNQKITVSLILKWSNYQISACRIRYVLNKHLKVKGVHKWTYYEF